MRTLLTIFFSLVIASLVSAQLRVKETSYSDNFLVFDPYAIVDINSNLQIHIDTDSLLLEIGDDVDADPKVLAKLEQLNSLLIHQTEILKTLRDTIASASPQDAIRRLGAYAVLMEKFLKRITQDEKLRDRFNELMSEYFAKRATLQPVYGTPQAFVISQFGIDKKTLVKQISESESFSKVNVRVVAFLKAKGEGRRKLHIKNFDNLADGDFFEVERWVTSFSEENIQAFEKNRVVASNLNKLASSNFKDIQNVVLKSLQSLDCFKTLIESNQNLLTRAPDLFHNNTAIEAFLSGTLEDLRRMNDLITSVKKTANESPDKNVLQMFNDTRKEFIDASTTTAANARKRIMDLPNAVAQNADISSLVISVNACLVKLDADIAMIKDATGIASGILIPFMKSVEDVEELTHDVLSFTVDQLPKIGYIDLKTSGKRDNGDEVAIELQVSYDKDKSGQWVTLKDRMLVLQQVKIYSVTNVNVIAASPLSRKSDVMLDKKFQFAPSGSLLFKVGARKYPGWNFVAPGLGFNMATPDFDLDGTPDFAAGGIITLFQDVLSFGLSYNTKTDSSLWFFGLSLPFSGINLPINNIQTK